MRHLVLALTIGLAVTGAARAAAILTPTARGKIRIGMTVAQAEAVIEQADGAAAVEAPHPYTEGPDSHYFKVTAPDGEHAILFETYAGKVNTFRAGMSEAVDFINGCV